MNKIYKLIWNKAKNCWVVASELAKGHGKNKSKSRNSVLAVFVMLALLGSTFLPADMVSAEDPADDGQIHYVSVGVNKNDKIKIRKNIYENGRIVREEEEEVEIDPNNNYSPIENPSYNAILIGPEARTGRGDAIESVINGVIAIGTKSIAMKQYSTALGTNAWAGAKGDIAVGWKSYTGSSKELEDSNKIAIGTESSALEKNGISIGNKSMARDTNAIAIGNEAETGSASNAEASHDSIAVGNKVKVQGQYNVAIGSGVTVGTKDSGGSYVVAIGSDSHAYDTDSIVIGGHSEVRENATVIGNRSKAGMESVALGSSIEAGEWSVAIGLSSKAHNHAIAMGMNSDVAGEYAIGIGEEARSFANQSVSMGYQAHAYVGESLAIGNSALVAGEKISKEAYNALSDAEKKNYTHDSYGNFYYKKSSESYSSTAVGPQARVYGKNATALGSANVGDIFGNRIADGGTAVGSRANAAYENATAVGYNSIAYAKDAVTLGANTRADIADGVALGSESRVGSYGRTDINNAGRYGYDPFDESRKQESPTWKSTKAAVSVGDKEKNITRQIVNVAAGKDDTDAVNVAQLKNLKYRAAADLEAAEKRLKQGIQKNAGDISNLSTKVDGNTSNINYLKNQREKDINNLQQSIEGHTTRFVSVNRGNTNKTSANYLNDGAEAVGSIAIGHNAHANGEQAVTLGYNSFSRGQGSVIIGETSNHSNGANKVKNGQFDQSIIVGSQNEVYARKKDLGGREDTILGSKNHITESHGTFVRGVGNYVADAYNDEALTDEDKQKEQDFLDPLDGGDPIGLFQKGRSHVSVEGDGNLVGGALYTQVSGVGNEVSNTDHDDGTSTPRVSYNIITGNRNTLTDSSHNLILGDNHELENVNGNIIIGSLKTKAKTEASNVTVLGNDANVSVEGGVALGTGSVADRAAGMQGYISLDKKKTIADGYKGMGSGDDYDYHTNQLTTQDETYKKNAKKYEEAMKKYEQATDENKKKKFKKEADRAQSKMARALKKKQESEQALESMETVWKSTKGAVSVGGYTVDTNGNRKLETRQITGVAAGTKDTDAVNVAQLKASTARYFSVNEVIPKEISKSTRPYKGSDEWGYTTQENQINDGAVGDGAVAVGENAQALQKYGAALGYGAKAKEERSLALGLRAEAEGSGSVAMGGLSIVEQTGKNSLSLGTHSRVTAANSIALGAESFVGKLDDIKTDAYLTGDKDKFTADNGVVSVGHAGYKKWTKKWQMDNSTKHEKEVVTEETVPDSYRRIVNVAGGAEDTDAVNVAQLKAGRTTVEAGDYVTVTSGQKEGVDGTVYTVKGPKLTSKDTNLTVTDEEETVAGTTDKKKVGYKLELSKTLTGLESVSSKVFNAGNNVTLGETGLTITGGPSVTTTGIDAGSKTITNVTAGAADGDAVNFKQLKDVDSKVTTNTGDITTLKEGWTLADAKTGKKVVKAKDTVKVTGDDYITATVDNDGLKLGMNETKLNTQINDQIDNSTTVKNKMNSWVLKAATTDKDPDAKGQTIDNTNNVATFDVEENQGLTVARDGAKIKYGVDNKQLVGNINSGNTAVTNISAKFSVTDGTNTKAVNLGKDKNNNVKFLGTDGETTVTVGGNDDAPTVTVGLDAKFKKKVTDNTSNIAANKTNITNLTTRVNANSDNIALNKAAIGENKTAIGENKTAIGENKTAIGENKTAIGENKTAIGENKTAIGENKTAIGENKTAIGENKTAIGENKTAIGENKTAIGENKTAIGENKTAIGENKTAIGENKTAIGENKTAIGENKTAIGENKTAIGENKTAIGENKTAIGENKTAIGENKTAIGENKTAIGENKTAIGENKTAIGENKTAIGENKTAIGENKTAIGENKTAIGENKTAIGENKTAIADKMTSWTVKAGAEDADGQKIDKTNNEVTFNVTGAGLTVERKDSTITYGIDGSKIDLSNNESIKKLKTVVKAGDENISVDELSNQMQHLW